jgi:hypothetical protein
MAWVRDVVDLPGKVDRDDVGAHLRLADRVTAAAAARRARIESDFAVKPSHDLTFLSSVMLGPKIGEGAGTRHAAAGLTCGRWP